VVLLPTTAGVVTGTGVVVGPRVIGPVGVATDSEVVTTGIVKYPDVDWL